MITEQQFKTAADLIGCDTGAVKAVYHVEAAGQGYLPDGRVKILFEGHRFWKQLEKQHHQPDKFLQVRPEYSNVLYPKWDKKQYKGGAAEWDRMSKAIEVCDLLGLQPELALDSASYGSFQIMGINSSLCGYPTAKEMLNAYNDGGEAEQLNSFIRFVKATHLDDELRGHNWAAFSKGYNGSQAEKNDYSGKLLKAYNSFA